MTRDVVKQIKERQSQMITQLQDLCSINSGSENLEGLARVRTKLCEFFAALVDDLQIKEFPSIQQWNLQAKKIEFNPGPALFLRKRPHLRRRILLVGHMDTVYSISHPFQAGQFLNETTLNGPGVCDMKGGLIILLHALTLFEQNPVASKLGWDIFINADEELGSPSSAMFYTQFAHNYQAAFVYEPSLNAKGTLARNRSGSGKFSLIARGKAAHVGRDFSQGRNAICYLASFLLKIQQLNGQRPGVVINIGQISGGEAINMVPATAIAKIDVRISQLEDEQWVKENLARIYEELEDPDYQLMMEGTFGRPVKRINAATQKLFHLSQKVAQDLNFALHWEDTGGCCDGNNLSQFGLAVLDTLGARGGHIHSQDEYILLDSFIDRTLLSYHLLRHLAAGQLEELFE